MLQPVVKEQTTEACRITEAAATATSSQEPPHRRRVIESDDDLNKSVEEAHHSPTAPAAQEGDKDKAKVKPVSFP